MSRNSLPTSQRISSAPSLPPGDGVPRLRRDLTAAFVLFLCVLVLFLPILARIRSDVVGSPRCDMLAMFYPLRDFANSELRAGRLPLWNPYILCGQPLHAEGQAAALYPAGLALAFLPTVLSIDLFMLFHWVAAGIAMFLYLRALSLSTFSSFFGAFVFLFSSGPVSRLCAGHYTIMPFLSLIPALLWTWEEWKRRLRPSWLSAAALIYGAAALAGYPQLLYYGTFYVLCHVAFFHVAAWRKGRGRAALRVSLPFLGALAVGVLIGAAQLIPTAEFSTYSSRSETASEFSATFSLAPENLLTLVAPGFFGDETRFPYWGRNNSWEMRLYLGVVPLALALFAVARIRSFSVLSHGVAAVVFIMLALGGHTPLFSIVRRFLPLFAHLRGASKFSLFALMSLCALAALAIERLSAEQREEPEGTNGARVVDVRRDIVYLLIVLGILSAATVSLLLLFGRGAGVEGPLWESLLRWRFSKGEDGEIPFSPTLLPSPRKSWLTASRWLSRSLLLSGSAFALVLLLRKRASRPLAVRLVLLGLTAFDLVFFVRPLLVSSSIEAMKIPERFVEIVGAEKEPVRTYPAVLYPNSFVLARLETTLGYAGLLLGRTADFIAASSGFPRHTSVANAPVPAVLDDCMFWPNVKYLIRPKGAVRPIAPSETVGESEGIEPVSSDGGLVLYRLRHSVPRAYFSDDLALMGSREQAIEMIESAPRTLSSSEWPDCIELLGDPLPDALQTSPSSSTVRFVGKEHTRLELQTETDATRLLVVSDAYEKNWRCRLDGRAPLLIYPVNVAFRGVFVPPGKHRVEFHYRPLSTYWGAGISLFGLLLTGVGPWLASRRPDAPFGGRPEKT